LDTIEAGGYKLTPQDESRVTLAPKLTEEEARLDWSQSSVDVINRIRGMRPNLVAFSFWRGRRLQIFKAQVSSASQPRPSPSPGSIISSQKALTIACGDGLIDLISVRLEGKKTVTGAEFARGARPEPSEELTSYPGGNEP
jgi:methionyl-tRNA formyltransferase